MTAEPATSSRLAWLQRRAAAISCAGITIAVFLQAPGRLVADTKLDLTQDPVQYLARAIHLWSPQAAFGELQNQAYGYLFPMGPFFALCHGIGVPGWIAQRIWQALLLNVAFLGMRELLRRLDVGTPATRVLGGLAYALCPAILGHVGSISAEILPECVAPWVLVPLVGAAANTRPRRAAMQSGVAVLCAGGVNGSATLAVLVLPALWLLLSPAGVARRRLAGWWAGAVVLATLWWAIPLVVLGRYSPPFLSWIESAQTTTSTAGVFAALTGTTDWLGHIWTHTGAESTATWLFVAHPIPIVCSAVSAAIGMAGLFVAGVRQRGFLVGAVLLGAVVITLGHEGPGSGPLAGVARSALDGGLAAFRNIWKFDVVVRIPLVIGFVYGVGAFSRHRVWSRLLAGVAVLAVAAVAVPAFAGQLEAPGSFSRLPVEWTEAASWLSAHDHDGGRALLLPAAQHPDYVWGLPTDEPLQVLATTPWAVRDVVPLGGAGEGRLLDGVDDLIESGRGSPGFATYLSRAGVQWLVVRNDLQRERENDELTSSASVQAALATSPGITPVAGFGPLVSADGEPVAAPAPVAGSVFRSLVIYHVSGPISSVTTAPLDTTLRVSGGPESLLELADAGLLPSRVATVMAADPTVAGEQAAAQTAVVTDGYRRQELNVGRASGNESPTLAAGQPWSQDRAGHEYVIGDPAGHQTTAVTYGVRAIAATSSASEASAGDGFFPSNTPAAGFGADPGTPWMTGSGHAVGQWLQADLIGDPVVRAVTVASPKSVGHGTYAAEVAVTTDNGTVLAHVPSHGAVARVAVAPGPTRSIRVTIRGVVNPRRDSAVPLLVHIPGVVVRRGLQVPDDVPAGAAPPTFVFEAEPLRSGAGDGIGINRAFTLNEPATYRVGISVTPRRGTQAVATACGVGPPLTIDSQTIPTRVESAGTLSAADGGRSAGSGCGATGRIVHLAAGQHHLVLTDDPSVLSDEITLTPVGTAFSFRQAIVRTVRITKWSADSRAVQIGSGPASWLVVTENANAGWIATLDGHRLTSGIVDGWKQAFIVPAGSGGLIRLRYAPDRIFRGGLLLGGVAALLLLGLAFAPERRRMVGAAREPSRVGRSRRAASWAGAAAGVVAVAFIGGGYGLAMLLVAAAVAAGCHLRWGAASARPAAGMAVLVIAGVLGASFVAAASPYTPSSRGAAAGAWCQILGLAALAAVAVSLALRLANRSGATVSPEEDQQTPG